MDTPMTLDRVREILSPECFLEDGGLSSGGWYLSWPTGECSATLDGIFGADELQAIAFWMKHSLSMETK